MQRPYTVASPAVLPTPCEVSPMGTHALTVEVDEPVADDVAALLLDAGAAGAEVRDSTVAPMPGAIGPPPGRAHVIAFFEDRIEGEAAVARLGLEAVVTEIPDRDWGETWKQGLGPFAVGRVFIRPSWTAATPPPGTVEVVLDPGMAFGTGTHPTTALCLAAIDALLRESPGADVLDVGTGSGLLGIAAKKLGAARVVGTESDPVALRVAAENAERNGVRLELRQDDAAAVPGCFRVVVANILANALVALAPALASRVAPGGTLVLSGILAGQEDEVRRACVDAGLEPRPDVDARDGEWRLVALRRGAAR